jgi:hypothetical protein
MRAETSEGKMDRGFRYWVAALSLATPLAITPIDAGNVAMAQAAATPPQEQALTQVALTESQVEAYLAVEPEIQPIVAKIPEDSSQAPDPKILSQLDAIAKKHKFASYEEFDGIGENISLVLDGIDPESKKYVGPDVLLKKQIAAIQADAKMPAADKKAALEEMNAALKAVEPLKFPSNIAIVVKYYDKIEAAMPQPPAQ